jgi:ribosome-associated translation inhibitor RaiA
MNIYFQSKNLEINQDTKNMMANRMHGLNKFFPHDTNAYITIERTTHHHNNGPEIYYVSIKIDDPHNQYFTEEYQENIRKAFDHAYGDMFRVVRSHRSKSRNLAKRAGQRIKKFFKRHK